MSFNQRAGLPRRFKWASSCITQESGSDNVHNDLSAHPPAGYLSAALLPKRAWNTNKGPGGQTPSGPSVRRADWSVNSRWQEAAAERGDVSAALPGLFQGAGFGTQPRQAFQQQKITARPSLIGRIITASPLRSQLACGPLRHDRCMCCLNWRPLGLQLQATLWYLEEQIRSSTW